MMNFWLGLSAFFVFLHLLLDDTVSIADLLAFEKELTLLLHRATPLLWAIFFRSLLWLPLSALLIIAFFIVVEMCQP